VAARQVFHHKLLAGDGRMHGNLHSSVVPHVEAKVLIPHQVDGIYSIDHINILSSKSVLLKI
jgi:hypothetical protein